MEDMAMHTVREDEHGFVLITSLITLGLMLVLSIGLWYRSAMNQQISSHGQQSAQALYYAESAINYLAWALANDAELDGEDTKNGGTDLIPGTTNANTVGDWSEFVADTFRPGPTSTGGSDGQLAYFDNRPIADRNGLAFDSANPSALSPDLSALISNNQMPAHLVLNISTSGHITLASPSYSTTATPTNGAVVWLTAADASGSDVQLDPSPASCTAVTNPVACINGAQVTSYSIVAYAVSYVNGTPMRFLRAVLATIP